MVTFTLHAVHVFLFLIFPARGPLSLVYMFVSSSQERAFKNIERTLLQLTTFAAVFIVPAVKLLVLCFNQTRICLFESHTHGLQSSIVVTNSTGKNSNFFTLIPWKDGYARQGGSLEGSNVAVSGLK